MHISKTMLMAESKTVLLNQTSDTKTKMIVPKLNTAPNTWLKRTRPRW